LNNKKDSTGKGGEKFQKRLKGEQRTRTAQKNTTPAKRTTTRGGFGPNSRPYGSDDSRKFDSGRGTERTNTSRFTKDTGSNYERKKTTRFGNDTSAGYNPNVKRGTGTFQERSGGSFKSDGRGVNRNKDGQERSGTYKKRSFDEAQRSYSKDRKEGSYQDRPQNKFRKDTERKPYRGAEGEERSGTYKKRSFDEGQRSYSKDRKEGSFQDRPQNSFRKNTERPSFRGKDNNQSEPQRGFRNASQRDAHYQANGPKRDRVPKSDDRRKEFNKTEKRSFKNKDEQASPGNYKGRGKQFRETSGMLEKGADLAQEEVRLNRFIAMSGSYSRRDADAFIQEGRVSINGEVVQELGTKVQPGDVVKLDGQRIVAQKPVYILLNKPKGYVTTTDDPEGRQTVMDLIQLPAADNLFPVGRLDRNTTGVLLVTNDGDLAQKIMHPSFNIKKIYRVKLDRKPSREHMMDWIAGVQLEDGMMSFEQVGFVEKEEPTVLGVEIHSGKNRIVRRMFEHFGYEVKSLDRVLLGEFDKLSLGRGRWRFLNEKELRYVMKIKGRKPKSAKRK
jgi:23S rRNA pseudouridine2605 synthase